MIVSTETSVRGNLAQGSLRVLYLNPFSQEVSGTGREPAGAAGGAGPGGRRGARRAAGAGTAGRALPGAGRDGSLRAAGGAAPRSVGGDGAVSGAARRAVAAVRALARRLGAALIHTNMEVLLEGGLAARALGHSARAPLSRQHARSAEVGVRRADRGVDGDRRSGLLHLARDGRRLSSAAAAARRSRCSTTRSTSRAFASARARRTTCARRWARARAHRLVGTVGRIHPRKDLETFVRAAARIAAARPRRALRHRRRRRGRRSSIDYERPVAALAARARARRAAHVRGRAARHPGRHGGAGRLRADARATRASAGSSPRRWRRRGRSS